MRFRQLLFGGMTFVFGLLSLAYAPRASAIPAWSRRYGVACGLCHTYPSLQLTADGLDFFRRGHRFSKDAADKDFTHMLSGHIEWEYDLQQGESTALRSPEFHLHAGGSFSPIFSAYLDVNINEDFEVIYLQATKELTKDSYVTLRGGKITPTLIRNYGNGLMASASNPLILTDSTLNANPFTPARDSYGADVGARWKNLFVQGGILNGDDAPGQAQVANHKDLYATAELNLTDDVSGVGLYYYRGGYDLGDPTTQLLFDRYDRLGVFANFTRGPIRLVGAYLTGTDSVETLSDRKIRGGYAQFEAHPGDTVVPFARYDEVKTEDEQGSERTRMGTVGLGIKLYEGDNPVASRLVLEAWRRNDGGTLTTGGLANIHFGF